jgi:hypothetical protein
MAERQEAGGFAPFLDLIMPFPWLPIRNSPWIRTLKYSREEITRAKARTTRD